MKILIGGKSFEVKEEDLTKAQESGELKLGENLIVRTEDEQNTWLNNMKPDIINTALEIEVKKRRNDLGLEFEGKTLDNLLKSYEDKLKSELTKEPNKALEDKEKDIQLLKATIDNLKNEKESVFKEYSEYKNNNLISSTLEKHLPDNLGLPKEDMLLLMRNKLKPQVNDSGIIFKNEAGDILKDKTTASPLGADNVIKTFFENNPQYLKGVQGGAGGSDSGGNNGRMNAEQYAKKLQEQGVPSQEIAAKINEAVIANEIDV